MTRWIRSLTLVVAVLLVGCSHQAHTQYGNDGRYYSDAQLDQMLAPIALYPDVVLSQVLMASTYPDQVEAAAGWSYANPQLEGSAAVDAVAPYDWDPSVKALVAFPDLIQRLASDPDWTWRLGDAYLAQEGDVIASIQRLRDHAYRSRHLESLDHLHVYRDADIIIIEPANPRLVYLPWYRPHVVYGDWWWPDYPPHYWAYPHHAGSSLAFYWGNGISLGTSFFFSSFHWHNHHIVTFDRHHYRPYNRGGNYYKHYRNPQRWHHKGRRQADRHYRGDDGHRSYGRSDSGRVYHNRERHNRDLRDHRDRDRYNRDVRNYRDRDWDRGGNRFSEGQPSFRDRRQAEHRDRRNPGHDNRGQRPEDGRGGRAHDDTGPGRDTRRDAGEHRERFNPGQVQRSREGHQGREHRSGREERGSVQQSERRRFGQRDNNPVRVHNEQRTRPQNAGGRPEHRQRPAEHNPRSSGREESPRLLGRSEHPRTGGFQARDRQQASPRARDRDSGNARQRHGNGNGNGNGNAEGRRHGNGR